jgi:hypothetical protein
MFRLEAVWSNNVDWRTALQTYADTRAATTAKSMTVTLAGAIRAAWASKCKGS